MGSAAPPGRVRQAVRGLAPGYFALVMASGIISVGLRQHGQIALSVALLVVCAAAFAVLVGLTGWRVLAHRDAVRTDFADPGRAFGWFTFIAGSNVLGVRLAMDGHRTATVVLLVVSGLTWIAFGYVIPWTAVLGTTRRPVLALADGSWFVWVVAGQSVAVAAATLEPALPHLRDTLAPVAVLSWSVGVCLYAAVGITVSGRLLLYDLRPEDLTPPYWIAMGAGAISVLAGARVVEMRPSPMVEATRGLIGGVSVTLWAFATWLLPALLAVGWWRHRVRRIPLVYDSSLWSIVFPLGMYAVAATTLSQAWALTFAAMVTHLARTLLGPGLRAERRSTGPAAP